jgi:tetratricopeptide (TPR) repeat protein
VTAFSNAIANRKDFAEAHESLAMTLEAQGKIKEAVAAYRTAGQFYKDKAEAARLQINLGNCLAKDGQLLEAEKEFRRAVELQPKLVDAHYSLGLALGQQGKGEAAIQSFRAAIAIQPDYAAAWGNLGFALQKEGEFAEALKALEKSRDLLPPGDPNRAKMQQYADRCAQLLELDRKLPEILKGNAKPKDADEKIGLAQVCLARKLYGNAARFYKEAFAEQPRLAGDPSTGRRYEAAYAAALAGCGRGKDDPSPDEKQRAAWRKQALDWLRADLEVWAARVQDGPPAAVVQTLAKWQCDISLAGVRGSAIVELPESEREGWQKLWADVEELMMKAKPKAKEMPPEKR